MTDKITLELTFDELITLDKNLYYWEETKDIFDKIKSAYPEPKMTFQQEGDYVVVSYNDTTYYRLMGETTYTWYMKMGVSANYPTPTLVMVTDGETERLLDGLYYNHIEVKKEKEPEEPVSFVPKEIKELVKEGLEWCEEHPGKNPLDWVKPQTPEQVADGLKEAFREAIKGGIIPEVDKLSDDFMDKMVAKLKGKTLMDLIYDWWEDIFTKNSDLDMENCIGRLVYWIEEWLPKEQSAAGSQNAYVECTVEGFNDCLNKIKRKLR